MEPEKTMPQFMGGMGLRFHNNISPSGVQSQSSFGDRLLDSVRHSRDSSQDSVGSRFQSKVVHSVAQPQNSFGPRFQGNNGLAEAQLQNITRPRFQGSAGLGGLQSQSSTGPRLCGRVNYVGIQGQTNTGPRFQGSTGHAGVQSQTNTGPRFQGSTCHAGVQSQTNTGPRFQGSTGHAGVQSQTNIGPRFQGSTGHAGVQSQTNIGPRFQGSIGHVGVQNQTNVGPRFHGSVNHAGVQSQTDTGPRFHSSIGLASMQPKANTMPMFQGSLNPTQSNTGPRFQEHLRPQLITGGREVGSQNGLPVYGNEAAFKTKEGMAMSVQKYQNLMNAVGRAYRNTDQTWNQVNQLSAESLIQKVSTSTPVSSSQQSFALSSCVTTPYASQNNQASYLISKNATTPVSNSGSSQFSNRIMTGTPNMSVISPVTEGIYNSQTTPNLQHIFQNSQPTNTSFGAKPQPAHQQQPLTVQFHRPQISPNTQQQPSVPSQAIRSVYGQQRSNSYGNQPTSDFRTGSFYPAQSSSTVNVNTKHRHDSSIADLLRSPLGKEILLAQSLRSHSTEVSSGDSYVNTASDPPRYSAGGLNGDKEVMERWYAQLSVQGGQSVLPTSSHPCSNSSGLLKQTLQQPLQPQQSLASHSVSQSEPFELCPTVCTEDVIEYKVADLLRFLPKCLIKSRQSNIETSANDRRIDHEKNDSNTPVSDENAQQPTGFARAMETEPLFTNQDKDREVPVADPALVTSILATSVSGQNNSKSPDIFEHDILPEANTFLDERKERVFKELILNSELDSNELNSQTENSASSVTQAFFSAKPGVQIPSPSVSVSHDMSLKDSGDVPQLMQQPTLVQNPEQAVESSVTCTPEDEINNSLPSIEVETDEVSLELQLQLLSGQKHMSSAQNNQSAPSGRKPRSSSLSGPKPKLSAQRGQKRKSSALDTLDPPAKQRKGKAGKTHAKTTSEKGPKTTRKKQKRGRPKNSNVAKIKIGETLNPNSSSTPDESTKELSPVNLPGNVLSNPEELKMFIDSFNADELPNYTIDLLSLKHCLNYLQQASQSKVEVPSEPAVCKETHDDGAEAAVTAKQEKGNKTGQSRGTTHYQLTQNVIGKKYKQKKLANSPHKRTIKTKRAAQKRKADHELSNPIAENQPSLVGSMASKSSEIEENTTKAGLNRYMTNPTLVGNSSDIRVETDITHTVSAEMPRETETCSEQCVDNIGDLQSDHEKCVKKTETEAKAEFSVNKIKEKEPTAISGKSQTDNIEGCNEPNESNLEKAVENKTTESHLSVMNSPDMDESKQAKTAQSNIALVMNKLINTVLKCQLKPSSKETDKGGVGRVVHLNDEHKMLWVRFHGRVVTKLIMPTGNFFIMTEILRRCFRIKEPRKNKKIQHILIQKKTVLKIPDTELPKIFYEPVIKNLMERQVIKTVPSSFSIIGEDDAKQLFHHILGNKYCGDGCVSVWTGPRAEADANGQSKESKKRELHTSAEPEKTGIKLESSKRQSNKDRNIFEIIDLCSDEEDGYQSDRTVPYIDGTPSSRLADVQSVGSLSISIKEEDAPQIKTAELKSVSPPNIEQTDCAQQKSTVCERGELAQEACVENSAEQKKELFLHSSSNLKTTVPKDNENVSVEMPDMIDPSNTSAAKECESHTVMGSSEFEKSSRAKNNKNLEVKKESNKKDPASEDEIILIETDDESELTRESGNNFNRQEPIKQEKVTQEDIIQSELVQDSESKNENVDNEPMLTIDPDSVRSLFDYENISDAEDNEENVNNKETTPEVLDSSVDISIAHKDKEGCAILDNIVPETVKSSEHDKVSRMKKSAEKDKTRGKKEILIHSISDQTYDNIINLNSENILCEEKTVIPSPHSKVNVVNINDEAEDSAVVSMKSEVSDELKTSEKSEEAQSEKAKEMISAKEMEDLSLFKINGEWVIPDDGYSKIERAQKQLQDIISRANKTKSETELKAIAVEVFNKFSLPLRQWTSAFMNGSKDELHINVERLQSLQTLQLQMSEEFEPVIVLDDDSDDIEIVEDSNNRSLPHQPILTVKDVS